jgi:hypothetical protein
MTVPAPETATRRARLLRRTRTITLGIAGGAAIASLGLGTALAHVLPGHGQPVMPRAAPAGAAPAGRAPAPHAPADRTKSGRAAAGTASAPSPPPAGPRHHPHRLAPPPAPPASTPAPAQASSGGS